MPDAAARKRALRASLRSAPRAERPCGAEQRCCDHLLQLLARRQGGWLALYAALPGDISLLSALGALRARGWRLAFPRVEGPRLVLGEIRRPEDLAPGYRGIPEPGSDAALVPAASVDVFAVPGVLFGRDGSRLGRGGGHYDRLLAEARPEALRVGVCYSDRVRAELPVEAWDQPVDLIITEQGVVGPLRGRPEPEVS